MIVSELLSHVKQVKPNPYSDEVLLEWVNDCEAKVCVEVRGLDPHHARRFKLPEDANNELFLPRPYDECYRLYLQAYIDFQLGEIDSYNNMMTMFNNAINEAKKFYIRTGGSSGERIKVVL